MYGYLLVIAIGGNSGEGEFKRRGSGRVGHRQNLSVHQNFQCKCRISSDLVGIDVLNSGKDGVINLNGVKTAHWNPT